MKVFISSVIRGLEAFRDAAASAARPLKHDMIRAEDFSASPGSPQRVCLEGVRRAEVTVLIVGGRYGDPQPSGLSATHEEYLEARERGDVLVFIQEGITREAKQEEFLREVQAWARGRFTASFSTPEELRDAVNAALHELELNRKSGGLDEAELVERARALVLDRRGFSSSSLVVVLSCGPRQQVLRPAEMEKPSLVEAIDKEARFGVARIFDRTEGTKSKIDRHQLFVEQDQASILVNEIGDIRIVQPAQGERAEHYIPVLIQEEVQERIERALRFGAWWLDHIDPKGRLSVAAVVASLANAGFLGWMTRVERGDGHRSVTMGMGGERAIAVNLSPASRPRATLGAQADVIAEDLTVLLRREVKR